MNKGLEGFKSVWLAQGAWGSGGSADCLQSLGQMGSRGLPCLSSCPVSPNYSYAPWIQTRFLACTAQYVFSVYAGLVCAHTCVWLRDLCVHRYMCTPSPYVTVCVSSSSKGFRDMLNCQAAGGFPVQRGWLECMEYWIQGRWCMRV